MQSIKEHNLKANHNAEPTSMPVPQSVCNLSKNTIWKQITTGLRPGLLFLFCMQSIKEHNLKANHNNWRPERIDYNLYAIYQRTQSESKSQLQPVNKWLKLICMQSIKEHNLKANHNPSTAVFRLTISVCNLSKNTIWKQITTVMRLSWHYLTLYAIYQRTQSESKSQQKDALCVHKQVCMQSIKEHNLKANHNLLQVEQIPTRSVCNLSKNTIWKQITTIEVND